MTHVNDGFLWGSMTDELTIELDAAYARFVTRRGYPPTDALVHPSKIEAETIIHEVRVRPQPGLMVTDMILYNADRQPNTQPSLQGIL